MHQPAHKQGGGQSAQHLLDSLDQIIADHGSGNPALVRDLRLLREELESALQRGRTRDVAAAALKVAAWAKFVYDLLHPD